MRAMLIVGLLPLSCALGTTASDRDPAAPTPREGAMVAANGPREAAGRVADQPPRDRPDQLSREEIVANMELARPRAHRCHDEHGSSGPAVVRVKVESGRVVEVKTLGALTGTPAAACIEEAVRLTAFPAGKGRSFDYILGRNRP
jgi:hypothetical protein